MVDINAKLTMEISVEDYEQVVRNDKGTFLGTKLAKRGTRRTRSRRREDTVPSS